MPPVNTNACSRIRVGTLVLTVRCVLIASFSCGCDQASTALLSAVSKCHDRRPAKTCRCTWLAPLEQLVEESFEFAHCATTIEQDIGLQVAVETTLCKI